MPMAAKHRPSMAPSIFILLTFIFSAFLMAVVFGFAALS